MFRNRSVDVHQFAMVPRAEIPRSSFRIQKTHKTTFDAGYLIPVYVDEILPGDTFRLKMTAFCRLATPIFPVMDNLYLDSFFFFVPNRLIWQNWERFNGSQDNPADSIVYQIPTVTSPVGGYTVGSLQDYMGLPTVGQMGGAATVTHNTLPLRAYNKIYNEWFRDENLQNSVPEDFDDGPDAPADYIKLVRGKRHDYFTSCLPWPQKGNTAVTLPLGNTAPVRGIGLPLGAPTAVNAGVTFRETPPLGAAGTNQRVYPFSAVTSNFQIEVLNNDIGAGANTNRPQVFADLTQATAATINQIRQAFQIQRLLERDARGGTRYTEVIRAHFGVVSPDARLQRPEYLGGGSTPIAIHPIAQTSGTGAAGTTAPLGNLSGFGTALAAGHGFSQSFTEHGYVIGLVSVRADLTYQQGIRKMWLRSTRYDFYWPAFAMLGEQPVLSKEIYVDGTAGDETVFGYQERWAEYRYNPSQITGLFKSTSAGTVDPWHLAQRFTVRPTLNATFISENPPISRIVAVGASANGQQFLCDAFFDVKAARPMPMYSVPGMLDHF